MMRISFADHIVACDKSARHEPHLPACGLERRLPPAYSKRRI